MLQEPSSTRLLNPTLSKELGETGYNALIEFATRTYYAQINEEEKEFMRMSSLRVLGRLDVGVLYEAKSRAYKFFVSETAIRMKTVLFFNAMGMVRGSLATDLAVALRGLIAYQRALQADAGGDPHIR